MKNCITYVVMNTNKDKFMVVYRDCGSDSLDPRMIYDTYAEAYRIAKIWNHGEEPLDETRHH